MFGKTTEDPRAPHLQAAAAKPDLNSKLIEWAPLHFLLMMEYFKAAGLDLPPR